MNNQFNAEEARKNKTSAINSFEKILGEILFTTEVASKKGSSSANLQYPTSTVTPSIILSLEEELISRGFTVESKSTPDGKAITITVSF
ncbi:hypothetical protein [Acinetobacter sp.]|uniref:hypothetical protein n=1 Tax=Acinetobacter sp. TaxID=472 RepID=UPI0039825539